MNADILIENATYYHHGTGDLARGTIAIKHGQIVSMGPGFSGQAGIAIDGTGKVVLPGFIDVHVHFRDLDLGYKETFTSGTLAAIHGGVTTAICMPNTRPPVISDAVLEEYMQRAAGNAYCNVGFYCGQPDDPAELDAMASRGVHGVKIYMERGLGRHDWSDDDQLEGALRECFRHGLRVHVHPGRARDKEEDAATFERLTGGGVPALQAFSAIHSPADEAGGLDRFLGLAARACKALPRASPAVHACHVSGRAALEVIAAWRGKFPGSITCEATPHHLFLSHELRYQRDPIAKVLQPLRDEQDRAAVMGELLAGTIDVIASDHAPHAVDEKTGPFMDAMAGFPVLDIHAPLVCTAGLRHGMTFRDIARACCEGPARLLGLEHRKGKVKVKHDADLVVLEKVDPRPVDVEAFHSQAKLSPYHEAGMDLEWIVTHVIVDGELVVEDRKLVGTPGDRVLRAGKSMLA